MRCNLMMAGLMAALLSACGSSTPFDASSLKVEVSLASDADEVTDGGLPVIPLHAEKLRVEAEVTATLPRLNGSPLAEVFIDAPAEAGAEGRSATLRLARVDGSESTFSGKVELRAAGAGEVQVRASVVGIEALARGFIRTPELGIQEKVVRDGWSGVTPRYRVCIESSATTGLVEVIAEGATIEAAGSTPLALEKGRCEGADGDAGLLAAGQSRLSLLVATAAPTATLRARLLGTEATTTRALVLEPSGDVQLSFVTDPPELLSLPAAGSLVRIGAVVRRGDQALVDLPVQFASLPAAPLMPEVPVTDHAGVAWTTLQVPEDVTSLRVDAVAAGVRNGLTLAR